MRFLLAAVAIMLLAACDQKPLKAPPGSFVKIVSVTPDTKSPLKVGDKVKVQVEVSYALTVDVDQTPTAIVREIQERLHLKGSSHGKIAQKGQP